MKGHGDVTGTMMEMRAMMIFFGWACCHSVLMGVITHSASYNWKQLLSLGWWTVNSYILCNQLIVWKLWSAQVFPKFLFQLLLTCFLWFIFFNKLLNIFQYMCIFSKYSMSNKFALLQFNIYWCICLMYRIRFYLIMRAFICTVHMPVIYDCFKINKSSTLIWHNMWWIKHTQHPVTV